MKRVRIPIAVLLLGTFILSGCVRSYSLFYDYDELIQNLTKAEIINMENEEVFFRVHSYVDVEDIDYEVIKELTYDDTDRLIRALSNIEFTYTILWIPLSVSQMFSMQGYGIKLSYESSNEISNAREPFIILAQTGDYRYGMLGSGQARAGRSAADEDWNALISEFYFD